MRQFIKSSLFIFFITVMGQVSYSQVKIGLKTGANLSNAKFINYEGLETDPRLSIHAGLLANIGINDKLLVRPELLYSVKGYQFDYSGFRSGRVKLHYLTIPLLLGYKPIKKVTILLGPEVGLLTSAIGRSQGGNFNAIDFYNTIDIGADLGVAYNLSPKVGLELRYNYGFTPLDKDYSIPDRNGKPYKDGRNRVLQLGTFFLLNGK
jgi:hypothetical protein